jgi:hypothetical protein
VRVKVTDAVGNTAASQAVTFKTGGGYPDIPDTGDASSPALCTALLVAGMRGAAGSIFIYRKSRGTRKRAAG